MTITVHFYSYFKEMAGCSDTMISVGDASTLADLLEQVFARHPKFREMKASMLMAVGVEYQKPDYRLKQGDVVSLFPPVQGG